MNIDLRLQSKCSVTEREAGSCWSRDGSSCSHWKLSSVHQQSFRTWSVSV